MSDLFVLSQPVGQPLQIVPWCRPIEAQRAISTVNMEKQKNNGVLFHFSEPENIS